MPTQASVIDEALDVLDKDKQEFERRVRVAVETLILNASRNDCVAIIRRYKARSYKDAFDYEVSAIEASGAKAFVKQRSGEWVCEWQVRMFGGGVSVWVKCFIAMLKHKGEGMPTYKDTELDSALTQPILKEVQDVWAAFTKEHGEVVSATMVKLLTSDPVIARQLAEQIASSMAAAGQPVTDEIRKAIITFLTEQVSTHVAAESVNQITMQVGQTIGDAALHSIAAGVGAALIHSLGAAITHLLAHAALTSAVKGAVLNIAGHMIAHHVIALGAAALLATLGVSATGAMYAFVLLPVVVAFAAWEAHRFPEKLAAKVAPTVAFSVAGTYRQGNKSSLEKIFNDTVRSNLVALAEAIVADTKIAKDIIQAVSTEMHTAELKMDNLIGIRVYEMNVNMPGRYQMIAEWPLSNQEIAGLPISNYK